MGEEIRLEATVVALWALHQGIRMLIGYLVEKLRHKKWAVGTLTYLFLGVVIGLSPGVELLLAERTREHVVGYLGDLHFEGKVPRHDCLGLTRRLSHVLVSDELARALVDPEAEPGAHRRLVLRVLHVVVVGEVVLHAELVIGGDQFRAERALLALRAGLAMLLNKSIVLVISKTRTSLSRVNLRSVPCASGAVPLHRTLPCRRRSHTSPRYAQSGGH